MIVYEVLVEVDAAQARALERYMRETHIPQILATGCFRRITFERAAPTRFRTRYEAATPADVDRYLAEHTAAFRADFAAHFPSGVAATREVWETLETWTANEGSPPER